MRQRGRPAVVVLSRHGIFSLPRKRGRTAIILKSLSVVNCQVFSQCGRGSGHHRVSAPALYRPHIANSGDRHIGPVCRLVGVPQPRDYPAIPGRDPTVPSGPQRTPPSPAIPSHPQPSPAIPSHHPALAPALPPKDLSAPSMMFITSPDPWSSSSSRDPCLLPAKLSNG